MKEPVHLIFTRRPSIAESYLKAIILRRKGLKAGEELPDISAVWKNVALDPALLKRYREACELPDDGYMPVLYPHVLASPVYMAVFLKTDKEAPHFKDLSIPRGIGKKYAGITGDYNPIHMSRLLAPLFGLKRDVAHAMWACANAMAHVPVPDSRPLRVDFAFKGPLFLDSKSHIRVSEKEGSIRFDYYCGNNDRPGINARIAAVKRGEILP